MIKLYFCSWNDDFELNKKYNLDKDSYQLSSNPEKASSKFSEFNCYFSNNEYDELCRNYKTKTLYIDKIKHTYALIYCYNVHISNNEIINHLIYIHSEITLTIVEKFQIWTLIDSEDVTENSENSKYLIYDELENYEIK